MKRFISPLTRRILAVNLVAPLILGAGLLYIDQYRGLLIEAQVNALFGQAELMAGAISESAIASENDTANLDEERARRILARLVGTNEVRARLFNAEGELVADSRRLISAGRGYTARALPPPLGDGAPNPFEVAMASLYDVVTTIFPSDPDLPPYQEFAQQKADHYAEATDALYGTLASNLRALGEGRIHISVAVPVQGLRSVEGALMLSVDSGLIEQQVRAERLKLIELFLLALVATVMVSIYLATALARPIRRLARAADLVRGAGAEGRRVDIPDFTRRRDEIGDLSASLRKMTDALYARMDAIESFAADVAHEIKNPLTSLRSAVESFARIKDEAKRERLAEILVEDVKRLNRLISDISDASRLDAELSRERREAVDLVQLVRATAELYVDASARVILDLPDQAVIVQGLDVRLARVLRNLLDNAQSFSPAGGVVALHLTRARSIVRLEIEDEGPGIPPDKLDAIFARFYTERPKGEAFGQHSGLGLAIARQIVENYGGRLWAENRFDPHRPGVILGARFLLELPAS